MTGNDIYEDGDNRRVGATFSKPYHFLKEQEVLFCAVLGDRDVRSNNGIDRINFSSFNMQGRYCAFTRGSYSILPLIVPLPIRRLNLTGLKKISLHLPLPEKLFSPTVSCIPVAYTVVPKN